MQFKQVLSLIYQGYNNLHQIFASAVYGLYVSCDSLLTGTLTVLKILNKDFPP